MIPQSLRKKSVNSRTAKEMYFIDACTDLKQKLQRGHTYDLLKASSILRQFLTQDQLINVINRNYKLKLSFDVAESCIEGKGITGTDLEEFLEKMSKVDMGNYKIQCLNQGNLKSSNMNQLLNTNCIEILNPEENIVLNTTSIIQILANKAGGVHFDSKTDYTTKESFFINRLHPYNLKEDNEFLQRIKELGEITLAGIQPLIAKVIVHLRIYNNQVFEAEGHGLIKIIQPEENN